MDTTRSILPRLLIGIGMGALVFLMGVYPVDRRYQEALEVVTAANLAQTDGGKSESLRIVIEWQPNTVELWEALGRSEFSLENWQEAQDAFEQAEKLNALSSSGRLMLARSLRELGLRKEADAIVLDEVENGTLLDRVTWQEMFSSAWDGMDYQSADNLIEKWLYQFPEDDYAFFYAGILKAMFQPLKALPYLVEAEQRNSKYASPVAELRQAINLALLEDDPAYQKVVIARALGNIHYWQPAEFLLREATAENPLYGDAWAFWGEARQQLGLDGYPQISQALVVSPNSVAVQALAGIYWRRQGKPENALDHYRYLVRLQPDEPTWQVELGYVLAESGDINGGLAQIQKAVMANSKDVRLWQEQAKYCVRFDIEVRQIGLASARQAVILHPDDPASLDALGLVMMALDDRISAERYLLRAVKSDPAYGPAHYHLGQLYLQMGRMQDAKMYLWQSIERLPENSEMYNYAKRLLSNYP